MPSSLKRALCQPPLNTLGLKGAKLSGLASAMCSMKSLTVAIWPPHWLGRWFTEFNASKSEKQISNNTKLNFSSTGSRNNYHNISKPNFSIHRPPWNTWKSFPLKILNKAAWGELSLSANCQLIPRFAKIMSKHWCQLYTRLLCFTKVFTDWLRLIHLSVKSFKKTTPNPHLKMPFVASVLFCVVSAIKPVSSHPSNPAIWYCYHREHH